ncbi:MAG: DNA repair protein RecN [Defluviitaleaceae bacterium]|nr:DNA repair protein RecN [Defluviitaleaceae bacterium]
MLENIYIKNVALIPELELNFSPNLNILSGETGAGKSIIIDSINFVSGGRVTADFVRRDADMASVTALFSVAKTTATYLSRQDIPIEDDNKIIIKRTINKEGKTTLRINGKTAPLATLKNLNIIDIHGQFEHQFLLNEKHHMNLLDQFCPSNMPWLKAQLSETINDYKAVNERITQIESQNSNIVTLQEDIEELDSLNITTGEEEEILKEIKYLSNYRQIGEAITNSLDMLAHEDGAEDKIGKATKYLAGIAEHLENEAILQELENISMQLQEIVISLSHQNVEFDQNRLAELEGRLSILHQAKRKYKMELEEILAHHQNLKKQLQEIEGASIEITKLKNSRKILQDSIIEACKNLTDMRTEAKTVLEAKIINNLQELGMENVRFEIDIQKKSTFGPAGNDMVAFLISPNLGEELKPLAKIASGGEMSRVMLSLKIVLSQDTGLNTFVFDEIDTGVSGRTAQKVAHKLHLLAKEKQILCITHLPQIAAVASTHFLIEKTATTKDTTTTVQTLIGEEITKELARLIGGAEITDNTMAAARELKEMAKNLV